MAIRQETLKKLERMKENIDEFALNNMGQPPSKRELTTETMSFSVKTTLHSLAISSLLLLKKKAIH